MIGQATRARWSSRETSPFDDLLDSLPGLLLYIAQELLEVLATATAGETDAVSKGKIQPLRSLGDPLVHVPSSVPFPLPGAEAFRIGLGPQTSLRSAASAFRSTDHIRRVRRYGFQMIEVSECVLRS
jgi:hypothetical protein